MNIQTTIHIFTLFSFFSMQGMELTKLNNRSLYPKTIHLDASLIETLITINAKNEFHRPFVNTREKRLRLLQELIHENVHVTFENNDPGCRLWISRQEPDIYLDVFYDTIFSFFSQKKFKTQRAFSKKPKTYVHTLWSNNSFLYIILTKPVTFEAEYALEQLLCDYRKNNQKKTISYQEISDDEDDKNDLLTTLPETVQELLTDMLSFKADRI